MPRLKKTSGAINTQIASIEKNMEHIKNIRDKISKALLLKSISSNSTKEEEETAKRLLGEYAPPESKKTDLEKIDHLLEILTQESEILGLEREWQLFAPRFDSESEFTRGVKDVATMEKYFDTLEDKTTSLSEKGKIIDTVKKEFLQIKIETLKSEWDSVSKELQKSIGIFTRTIKKMKDRFSKLDNEDPMLSSLEKENIVKKIDKVITKQKTRILESEQKRQTSLIQQIMDNNVKKSSLSEVFKGLAKLCEKFLAQLGLYNILSPSKKGKEDTTLQDKYSEGTPKEISLLAGHTIISGSPIKKTDIITTKYLEEVQARTKELETVKAKQDTEVWKLQGKIEKLEGVQADVTSGTDKYIDANKSRLAELREIDGGSLGKVESKMIFNALVSGSTQAYKALGGILETISPTDSIYKIVEGFQDKIDKLMNTSSEDFYRESTSPEKYLASLEASVGTLPKDSAVAKAITGILHNMGKDVEQVSSALKTVKAAASADVEKADKLIGGNPSTFFSKSGAPEETKGDTPAVKDTSTPAPQ